MVNKTYPSKLCTKCGVSKPRTEFNKDRGRPDGLFYWCKECAKRINNANNLRYRTPYVRYALDTGCFTCGYNTLGNALEFHHLDHRTKVGDVKRMCMGKAYTPDQIWEEIDKCVVLCANCHREQQARHIVFSWDGMDEETEIEETHDRQYTFDLSETKAGPTADAEVHVLLADGR